MNEPTNICELSWGRTRYGVRPQTRSRSGFRAGIRVVVAALVVALTHGPARADFMTGLAAYDAGNYHVAVSEWLPLARKGDATAQVALAGLYEAGLGVPQDYRAAAQWYRAAAAQGDAIAALNLGSYYRRGFGVERDPTMAFYWFSVAAAAGNEWARAQRDAVGASLSPGDRQRADRMLHTRQRPR